jgi:transposase/heme-degrading monooxygenase HmoA
MIIRVFSARLRPGAREAYEELCLRVSAPLMSAQPGFLTWRMGAERPDHPDDFVFISLWRDLESLKAFTGEQWQAASILPGEADLLERVAVRHYDESWGRLMEMSRAVAGAVKAREERATSAPLTDEQWERIWPLLPVTIRGGVGRPRANDRRTLDGVLYVLRSGCRWRDLPRSYGSPVTCWRRFSEWEASGVWERVWAALLATLDAQGKQAWALAFMDRDFTPIGRGRAQVGRPTDWRRTRRQTAGERAVSAAQAHGPD